MIIILLMEKEYLLVVTAGILSGLVVFGARVFAGMGLSFYQISIFPALFILILLPLVAFNKACRLDRSMLRFFIIFGFLSALTCFTEIGPIILGVPVAIVVLLLYTQPLWTVLLGRIFLKEDINKRKVLALVLVLVGVFVILNPATGAYPLNALGIVLALVGGILLSGWFLLGRVSGMKRYNPVTTQFGYYVFILFFLLISYPIVGLLTQDVAIMDLSLNLSPHVWSYLFLFMVFAVIIPHLLYFHGSKRVPASDAGIIFLLEPVSASVLAALFFNEAITLNILIGGALILLSNYLVIRKKDDKS